MNYQNKYFLFKCNFLIRLGARNKSFEVHPFYAQKIGMRIKESLNSKRISLDHARMQNEILFPGERFYDYA